MSIVEFPRRDAAPSGDWRPEELRELTELFAPARASITWEVGLTEAGDPQFYLLGPAPDHDCVLCVSLVVSYTGTGGLTNAQRLR